MYDLQRTHSCAYAVTSTQEWIGSSRVSGHHCSARKNRAQGKVSVYHLHPPHIHTEYKSERSDTDASHYPRYDIQLCMISNIIKWILTHICACYNRPFSCLGQGLTSLPEAICLGQEPF